jgi:hypothetical protein
LVSDSYKHSAGIEIILAASPNALVGGTVRALQSPGVVTNVFSKACAGIDTVLLKSPDFPGIT